MMKNFYLLKTITRQITLTATGKTGLYGNIYRIYKVMYVTNKGQWN